MVDSMQQPVDLHVCVGLSDDAGLLWGLEARDLRQLGAREVVGLARVLDAGYVAENDTGRLAPGLRGMAVVATRAADYHLGDPEVTAHITEEPVRSVQVLTQLAEGLAALHSRGRAHGGLWPGAVYVRPSSAPERDEIRCSLAHFEMSTMLANHARVGLSINAGSAEVMRYAAPELAEGPGAASPRRIARGDVYSLAAIAAEWFTDISRSPTERDGTVTVTPAVLSRLLARMLGPAEDRPLIAEVVRQLHDVGRVLTDTVVPTAAVMPHLLFFMPQETHESLRRRGWIDELADPAELIRQISSLMAADLRHGRLLFSDAGASPFLTGRTEALREAKYVLLGEQVAWFCSPYRPRDPFGRREPATDDVLILKYSVPVTAPSVRELLDSPLHSPLPEIEILPVSGDFSTPQSVLEGRPSWASVTPRSDYRGSELDRGLGWLLHYQAAAIKMRRYACTTSVVGNRLSIDIDDAREDAALFRDPPLAVYAAQRRRRPPIGQFLREIAASDEPYVELLGDAEGRPAPEVHRSLWAIVETGEKTGSLAPVSGANRRPPERCWIRPASDNGATVQLTRQFEAVREFRSAEGLKAQLLNPLSVQIDTERWAPQPQLGDEGAVAVKEMLTYTPLYALQGPPGTGKTTITGAAIVAWLRANPHGRLLVAAATHVALDTLAGYVLRELGDDSPVIVLRSVRGNPELVSPAVQPWTDDRLTVRTISRARSVVSSRLASQGDTARHELLERWLGMLDDPRVVAEVRIMLARCANVVLTTAATAVPGAVSPGQERDLFDWAVVEEAARMWPTELVMPLLRARRWTLVGDHQQLPAHGRLQVEQFLGGLEREPALVDDRPDDHPIYLRTFDLFQGLFGDTTTAGMRQRPVRRLALQYRMAEPISDMIGRVFYPAAGSMDSGRSFSGLHYGGAPQEAPRIGPSVLQGRALTWINTRDRPDCADQPQWRNQGEADLIGELTRSFADTEDLAVLTPYRDQVRVLNFRLELRQRAATAHAFQGREAEIVIVSLVRDTMRGGRPTTDLGHLSQPQLVNVLLSRARRMLILVGNFEHFASFEDTVWGTICRIFRERDAVLPASAVVTRPDAG
ncbi:AAA domain-containing protein [Dactylosporangium salmoneum]|uniref:AAA domain-containing protein n=1 Tax=Dactylosporangium salmoneum TaxID=53361 RepID=UPI0031D5EB1F